MDQSAFVAEFLGFLERREARLLSWGFYDVSFGAEEARAALEQEGSPELVAAWQEQAATWGPMTHVLGEMAYRRLLHAVARERYRTRFAETVRLLARLRQLFKYEDWSVGPGLVSDIKLELGPRLYPRTDQTLAACWDDLAPLASAPDLQRALFEELSRGRAGAPLSFAAFQRRAFARILARYGRGGTTGTMVSAGTGAGKTKAFYVPALLGAAADLARDASPYTKIIAVYPRNVLLADQLREAISEAAKLRPTLAARGLRGLTFGALLGDTPWEYFFDKRGGGKFAVESFRSSWKRVRDGFTVPFLKSPNAADCALVWRHVDREAGVTALYREASGEPDVPDGVLRITREQLQEAPPDVLFLSLEMLNRELGNPSFWEAFGIRSDGRGPRLLLLDEVHTYDGLHGAQAVWVLRRWLHWVRPRELHVVGLSATLRDAANHLALVSGVAASEIVEIAPAAEELAPEGMEYNLLVKGDPSSGASLLSTTIQTGMLLARAQTPRTEQPAEPGSYSGAAFHARKVFGFSDNLDVLNRWLQDMTDAEQRLHLARLRLPPARRQPPAQATPAMLQRMRDAGQIWELPIELGYDLPTALIVTRCSSQDPGVDAASDLVVATSSLEVGFDDPEVAVTLHHKSPRSMASFVQRKGRAGRRRGTRPWTVVVLSDYGLDRWSFQQAERLFSPTIDALFLPMANPYVLRIQATYFLVDWLGHTVRRGSPYVYLAEPKPQFAEARRRAVALLREMIEQGPAWQTFRADLRRALRWPRGRGAEPMTDAEFDAILWEPPRPVLVHAIPALLRKLESDWRVAKAPGAVEDAGMKRPLPSFLPGATFGELDASEVRLEFHAADGEGAVDKHDQTLGVSQALFETCPGHVSKRYSTGRNEAGHWLSGSARILDGARSLPIGQLVRDALYLETVNDIDVYQPICLAVEHRPASVLDTSRSAWRWNNRLRSTGAGHPLPVLQDGDWARAFSSCDAHLHRDRSSIEVLRWARTCDFEVRQRQADPIVGTLELGEKRGGGEGAQALGFRQRVDGVVARVRVEHLAAVPEPTPPMLAHLRPAYFQHLVRTALEGRVNPFAVDWLCQAAMAALVATAALKRCSLEQAQVLLEGRRHDAARRVLERILPAGEAGGDEPAEATLTRRLLDILRDPVVAAAIADAERSLWEPPTEGMRDWLRRRHVATLAQALRLAAVAGVPEVSEDDLAIDVSWPAEGGPEIHLTELAPGGLGHIERIVDRLRAEPDRFHEAFEYALVHCPREAIAELLGQVAARAVRAGNPMEQVFRDVRNATSYAQMEAARAALERTISDEGLRATRVSVVAVVTRLLRPGSRRESDVYTHFLNLAWRRAWTRLGVEIDPRVMAYVCTQSRPLARRFSNLLRLLGGGQAPTSRQLDAIVQQMLLGECGDSCRECLDHPSRFSSLGGRPYRQMALRWLGLDVPRVDADEHPDDWPALSRAHLTSGRRVRVVVSSAGVARVAALVQGLLAEELEIGHLFVPPRVARIDRDGAGWQIMLVAMETTHGQP
jgi:hypothetical protein